MRINTQLLKARMVERGISAENLAKLVGMNPSTFYRKMKTGGNSFTVAEMFAIVDALELTDEDAVRIFLQRKLA